MYVSAFENTNGTVAVPVINEAHYERTIEVQFNGCEFQKNTTIAYLADNDHNNTMVGMFNLVGSTFRASVPPRSMTTFFLE
jgi:glucosylceramidase